MKIKFIALVFAWYFIQSGYYGSSTIGPFDSEEQCNWGRDRMYTAYVIKISPCWYIGPISEKR